VPWLLYRKSGNRFWKQISVPLLLHGSSVLLYSFSQKLSLIKLTIPVL
jgi:hypothetical protein